MQSPTATSAPPVSDVVESIDLSEERGAARSEESQALQQFSTPIALGFAAATAAAITPTDLVLEPSAGTGLLAIFAEIGGAVSS